MESGKTEMEEEEHKVYGGEIPEIVGKTVAPDPDIDMSSDDDDDDDEAKVCFRLIWFCIIRACVCDCVYDFEFGCVNEAWRDEKCLNEIEKEADVLRELQAKFQKDIRAVQGGKIDWLSIVFNLLRWLYRRFLQI